MTLPHRAADAINTLIEYVLGLDPDGTGVPVAAAAREAAIELAGRAYKSLAAGITPMTVQAYWPSGTDPVAVLRNGVVDGHCPMGCGHTLYYSDNLGHGRVVCRHGDCPNPLAVAELLADAETEHLVTFTAERWTVKHPLRERLDDVLMDCDAADVPRHLLLPPPEDGPVTYRLTYDDENINWALHPVITGNTPEGQQ